MQESAKKQILVFSTAFFPHVGGAEVALSEITSRLSDEFEFHLITPRLAPTDLETEMMGHIRVYRVGGWLRFLPQFFSKGFFAFLLGPLKAWRLSHSHVFDLIFSLQASQGGAAAAITKSILNIPMLLNFQEGKQLHQQWFGARWLRSFVLRSADWVTAISKHLMIEARRSGVDARHISIIPNGVDLGIFKPMSIEERSATRRHLGLPVDRKIVITASRLVQKNGIDTLIRAISYIKDESALLLIAGDGHLRKDYEKLVASLQPIDRVQFLDTLPHRELAQYIACSDVFARPSRSEGLGSAFLEAMAAGTPIVTTPVGGIPDFLSDGITGLEARVDDPVSVARAIDRYFDDENLYLKIREAGIELVSRWYTWDGVAEQYRKDFRSLINHGKIEYSTNSYPETGKRVLVITQKMDRNDDLLGFFPAWIDELGRHSAQVDVLALHWGEYTPHKNIRVISLGKDIGVGRYARWILFFWHMIWLSRNKDLIFAHMSPVFAIAAWPFARLRGARLMLWYVHRSVTRRLKIAERLVDQILTTTKESFRLPSKKVRYVGHGIDIQYLRGHPEYDCAEHTHKVGDPWRFIAVGRLSPIKNYETLLAGFRLLRDRGIDCRLTIIGEAIMSGDRDYEKRLRSYVHQHDLESHVRFTGKLPFNKIASYYHDADIAFNMTPTGGLDKAVLEPMAIGLPVILSNEAFRPFLGEFADRLLFCYNDPADLAQKTLNLLVSDRAAIQSHLRKMVEEKHSIPQVVQHILND